LFNNSFFNFQAGLHVFCQLSACSNNLLLPQDKKASPALSQTEIFCTYLRQVRPNDVLTKFQMISPFTSLCLTLYLHWSQNITGFCLIHISVFKQPKIFG